MPPTRLNTTKVAGIAQATANVILPQGSTDSLGAVASGAEAQATRVSGSQLGCKSANSVRAPVDVNRNGAAIRSEVDAEARSPNFDSNTTRAPLDATAHVSAHDEPLQHVRASSMTHRVEGNIERLAVDLTDVTWDTTFNVPIEYGADWLSDAVANAPGESGFTSHFTRLIQNRAKYAPYQPNVG